ncbi:MAG: 4-hydroxy-3-methylbut-2-enyl diphosphate reductase [Helicobacteraceae bacterium]|nr:4-hydroxy-3-methylbut-2-enyl diphosphate reductase [Helicobacteraceae bacterium]
MKVKLAESCGFCFGVKRAIALAERNPNATTFGELIHNSRETERLNLRYGVKIAESLESIAQNSRVIIRTHGIEKDTKIALQQITDDIIDATCPYVTKPQTIAETISAKGYQVVIFGDKKHPEVKGVLSYAGAGAIVVADVDELCHESIADRVALISQTTKSSKPFALIAASLIDRCKEVRVFNTICNATFRNQDATRKLSNEVDMMIIVGGKNSSNTKQLFAIAKSVCENSYLIEDAQELDSVWFEGKAVCGISAGASTPDWIINEVIDKAKAF